MILMSYTHEELNASEASQGSSPMTTTKVSRLQKEGEGRKKKTRKRTDVCDLCLTPQGISATDNLIQVGA